MAGLNKAMLIGRLGADVETNTTKNGKSVARLSLATSEKRKGKNDEWTEKTEWHKVIVWGKLADLCGKHLSKGSMAYVEGRIETRSWDDQQGNKKYATEIVADKVLFMGGNKPKQEEDEVPF